MSSDRRTAPPSVLFDTDEDRLAATNAGTQPFFVDLNLDQIIDAFTANWTEYDLKSFFYFPLNRDRSIQYRHEIFQDLENPALLEQLETFARCMRAVRVYVALAKKLYNRLHKEGWYLHAVEIYCDAIKQFASNLVAAPIGSRGLLAFRDYLTGYAASAHFASLVEEAKQLATDLSRVKYCILIRDNSFTVRGYESETDYSAEIEETFKKFQQGSVKDYKAKYRHVPEDMNHIEAKVLEFVARLNLNLFSRLLFFCDRHNDFIDEAIALFDREIHFYIAYLDHISRFRRSLCSSSAWACSRLAKNGFCD